MSRPQKVTAPRFTSSGLPNSICETFCFLAGLTYVTKRVTPVFCIIDALNVEHTFAMCAKSIQNNPFAVQIRVNHTIT